MPCVKLERISGAANGGDEDGALHKGERRRAAQGMGAVTTTVVPAHVLWAQAAGSHPYNPHSCCPCSSHPLLPLELLHRGHLQCKAGGMQLYS